MTETTHKPRRSWLFRVPFILLMLVVLVPVGAWTAAAIYYSNLPSSGLRGGLAAVFVLLSIVAFAMMKWKKALVLFLGVFGLVVVWFLLIPARNDRVWMKDVAVTPRVQVIGDKVSVKGIRSCRYRSETDYDIAYFDAEYDASQLRSVDLIMSYWGPRAICHTFVSFGFADGRQLAVSIETRKEVGEEYSAIAGLFRQYELIDIFADEQDVIGLRTNFRHEDVYLYRLGLVPERMVELFLNYCRGAEELALQPRWYNAATESCGVSIIYNTWAWGHGGRFSPWMLTNGYWDEVMYKRGVIDNTIPFEQLRSESKINDRANAAGIGPDFSEKIRVGLRTPKPIAPAAN